MMTTDSLYDDLCNCFGFDAWRPRFENESHVHYQSGPYAVRITKLENSIEWRGGTSLPEDEVIGEPVITYMLTPGSGGCRVRGPANSQHKDEVFATTDALFEALADSTACHVDAAMFQAGGDGRNLLLNRMSPMDVALGKKIIALRERVAAHFQAGNWTEIGLLTGTSDIIDGHSRLLRSLSWGDNDYAGNALSVLDSIGRRDVRHLATIKAYLDERWPGEGEYLSAKPSQRRITFAPNVFQVPDGGMELDLVAVMMPFSGEFTATNEAIKSACKTSGHRCLRVDDVWEESVLVQDIFTLIFRSHIVVVDYTGKNPNVMYETGIAHTLGKHVVPIAQSKDDVPFDLRHHRFLVYLPNMEGRAKLVIDLAQRLKQLGGGAQTEPKAPSPDDDDISF